MFGPKLDSKSYTTFLLIVIGVLLSLNLFAQRGTTNNYDPEGRYDLTAVQREIAASNQAVASATTQVAASNQQIAQALNSIAAAINAKNEFDVNVTMSEDGTPVRSTSRRPTEDFIPLSSTPRRPTADSTDDMDDMDDIAPVAPRPTPTPLGSFQLRQ